MNAFFFCLEGTAVMEEFSYACPRGCCVSLLSPLENVTIKGRKKIMGEREHPGAFLREIPGASGTELDASAMAPSGFPRKPLPPIYHSLSPLFHKSSQIFSNHFYCTENEIKENLRPSLPCIYKLVKLCFHFLSFILSQSKW